MNYAVCDVCRLVDGDQSIKLCSWCSLCGAWICQQCSPDAIRRATAMMRRAMYGDEA